MGEDPPPAQSLTVEQKDKMDIQDQIFEMIISEHEDEQDSMSIKCEPRRVEDEMECLSLLKEWSSMPSADDFERFIIERELPSSTGQLKQEDKHARDLDVPLPVMTGDKQDSALVCTKLREIPARKAEKEVNEEVKNLSDKSVTIMKVCSYLIEKLQWGTVDVQIEVLTSIYKCTQHEFM